MSETGETTLKRKAACLKVNLNEVTFKLEENIQHENSIPLQASKLEDYVSRFKKLRLNNLKVELNNEEKVAITIPKTDIVKVAKGYVNLPKEIVIEALAHKNNFYFKSASNSGRSEYYYPCSFQNCSYKLKIIQKGDEIKNLTTVNLINNFKDFDMNKPSELVEGMCHLTELGEHNHPCNEKEIIQIRQRPGKF